MVTIPKLAERPTETGVFETSEQGNSPLPVLERKSLLKVRRAGFRANRGQRNVRFAEQVEIVVVQSYKGYNKTAVASQKGCYAENVRCHVF